MNEKTIVHDISMTLKNDMVCYPKDVPYHWKRQRDMDKGDGSNVSQFESSCHIGTHVDSSLHYYNDGYDTADIPLDHLYGPAYVVDCRGQKFVTRKSLEGNVPSGTQRLLLKTDNSQPMHDNPRAPFNKDFVYVDGSGADFCVENGIKLVGIDYLTIDKSGLATKPAHHTLLENKITILEGIILATIASGEYYLCCGSLKMAQSDGAPARTVLLENPIQ
jgi:arylformamidase